MRIQHANLRFLLLRNTPYSASATQRGPIRKKRVFQTPVTLSLPHTDFDQRRRRLDRYTSVLPGLLSFQHLANHHPSGHIHGLRFAA